MKLPDDKKERQKILGLIAAGVIAVCYVGYTYGIKPLLQKRQNAITKITELDGKLWQANLDIKQIPVYMQQNNEIIDGIIDISENKLNVLHPNLGNFLLVAEGIIEKHAKNLKLTIKDVQKIAQPGKRLKKENTEIDPKAPRFASYTVKVEMECGFLDLTKLIHAIEEENPYLCITSLAIIGQEENVTQHALSFEVQWPIWVNPRQPIKLMAEQMISKSKQ